MLIPPVSPAVINAGPEESRLGALGAAGGFPSQALKINESVVYQTKPLGFSLARPGGSRGGRPCPPPGRRRRNPLGSEAAAADPP